MRNSNVESYNLKNKDCKIEELTNQVSEMWNHGIYQNLMICLPKLKKIKSKKKRLKFFEKKEISLRQYAPKGDTFQRLVVFQKEKELFEICLVWNKDRTKLTLKCAIKQ